MNKQRKQYDEEFKKRAVQLSYDPNRTTKSVIDSLGISNSMLYRWREKYSETSEPIAKAIRNNEVRR